MTDNEQIFSVTDAANKLKNVVEGAFSRIRIRGELSQITKASSGHVYMTVKDSGAAINAILWRGTPVNFEMADGLEVIVTGKFTTYPARSNYQIIVSEIEMAGAGAILKMLEDRKKKLSGEGLFDSARKKTLPRFPETIGIVTSPTGAAIQDMLNKLRDRLPVKVIIYPATVQGVTAAAEVTAGIEYFNSLPPGPKKGGGSLSRPDVIIVARGGGALEDLLPFSEEIVVRAAAASKIPLISGVGHEPDWMLIDFAADYRAPTPTGAAEIVVPTKLSLLQDIENLSHRMKTSFTTRLVNAKTRIESINVKNPKQLIMEQTQRLDDLGRTMNIIYVNKLGASRQSLVAFNNLDSMLRNRFSILNQHVLHFGQMLNSLSYKNVLNRGYAMVRAGDRIISRAGDFRRPATIEFSDGLVEI